MVSFPVAVGRALRNYATFTGRATRAEYVWFFLLYVVLNVAANVLDILLPHNVLVGEALPCRAGSYCPAVIVRSEPGYIFDLVVAAALYLPLLSITVRRLRDAGYRWGWALLYFVPYTIGEILGVGYLVTAQTPGGDLSLVFDAISFVGGLALLLLLLQPTRHAVVEEQAASAA